MFHYSNIIIINKEAHYPEGHEVHTSNLQGKGIQSAARDDESKDSELMSLAATNTEGNKQENEEDEGAGEDLGSSSASLGEYSDSLFASINSSFVSVNLSSASSEQVIDITERMWRCLQEDGYINEKSIDLGYGYDDLEDNIDEFVKQALSQKWHCYNRRRLTCQCVASTTFCPTLLMRSTASLGAAVTWEPFLLAHSSIQFSF